MFDLGLCLIRWDAAVVELTSLLSLTLYSFLAVVFSLATLLALIDDGIFAEAEMRVIKQEMAELCLHLLLFVEQCWFGDVGKHPNHFQCITNHCRLPVLCHRLMLSSILVRGWIFHRLH